MFPVVEILVTFIVAFSLGCLAADLALRKKTGNGIEVHLLEPKNSFINSSVPIFSDEVTIVDKTSGD